MRKKFLVFFVAAAMVVQSALPVFASQVGDDILPSVPVETTTVETEASTEEITVTPFTAETLESVPVSSTEDTTTEPTISTEDMTAATETATVDPTKELPIESTEESTEEPTLEPETSTEAPINTTIKVKFDANGGSLRWGNSTKRVRYGKTYGYLPTPTRDGYDFEGWYTEAKDGVEIVSTDTVDFTSDVTLYAHWSVVTYQVKFDANGGEVDVEFLDVAYNDTYGELPVPTRDGYEFDGWYTSKSGKKEVTEKDTFTYKRDITLYAHWVAPTFEVKFDANGGDMRIDSKKVNSGEKYGYLATPQREGYKFEGWYTDPKGGYEITSKDIVDLDGDITLYAHWEARTFRLRFDANGGRVDVRDKTVTYDDIYGELPVPTRAGYEFDGWYTYSYNYNHNYGFPFGFFFNYYDRFHNYDRYDREEITSDDVVDLTHDIVVYASWVRDR